MNVLSNIKAFLFDIDGTLINRQCKMSSNMYKTLKYLKDNGYIIGINSGRPVFSSRRVLKANDADKLFDYYYGCNGIEFFDKSLNKTTYINAISNKIIKEYANKLIEPYICMAMYYDDSKLLVNHYIKNKDKLEMWGKSRFVKPELYDFNLYDGKAPKLVYLFDHDDIELVDKRMKTINDERIDYFYSGSECGEIVPKGANKGIAVSEFAKLLGISNKEIMCFGDAENDVPALLRGTGVMMDYPELSLKYNIELSCKDVDNDGIYNFLKEYLPIE